MTGTKWVNGNSYRNQFRKGLELIARSGERLAEAGVPKPVLVGGAAAEFYYNKR
jgi:hypothetical protein